RGGGNVDIRQLPLEISMGDYTMLIGERKLRTYLQARIYDLGILAFRMIIPLDEPETWENVTDLMASVQSYPPSVTDTFNFHLDSLHQTLQPALERPNQTIRAEDYVILLIEQLGAGMSASQLALHPVLLQAALGERRPLSRSAESLATSLSYYEDDLTLLTWSAAIVIEPDAAARDDAALLLEFANAQLLAFRSYDATAEDELARIIPRIARRRMPIWTRMQASSSFLREIYGLITEITDTNARVENALKVTEDIYWNRVYSAALATLRVEVWRTSINETLTVLRETASLLHEEAQETWTTLLELLVITLIAVELVVALLGLHH
ncbi:MAG: hypothetical protein ACLQUY_17365, partial [Ktedonobacterales bacterium]